MTFPGGWRGLSPRKERIMKRNLLIVATLDTKGREAGYVRDVARERGARPLLMDIGVVGEPQTTPDIANSEVARKFYLGEDFSF